MLYISVPVATNTFTWSIPSGFAVNALEANVLVTDSISQTSNSTYLKTYTISSKLEASAIIPPSPTMYGQYITLYSNASGGTAPYTINWFSHAGCSGSAVGSGTSYTSSPSSDTTYSYNVVDSASTPNVACSPADFVSVYKVPSGGVLSKGTPGTLITSPSPASNSLGVKENSFLSGENALIYANVSRNRSQSFYLINLGMEIVIRGKSAFPQLISVVIRNITTTAPPLPEGNESLLAFSVNSTLPAVMNITLSYSKSLAVSQLLLLAYSNSTWKKIGYAANATLHTVSFVVNSNAVAALSHGKAGPACKEPDLAIKHPAIAYSSSFQLHLQCAVK